MTKIERFEDLQCWQKARALANEIYDLTTGREFARDFELSRQIRAAAGSVMHNIAEGFEAGRDAEFVRFLRIAKRSASEVQSQLYLALDRGYITKDKHISAYDHALDVKRLINGLIAYLKKQNRLKGSSVTHLSDEGPHDKLTRRLIYADRFTQPGSH